MSRISRFTSKMPLSGRAMTGNVAKGAVAERSSLRKKTLKCIGAGAFMLGMAYGHGFQARMGGVDVVQDAQEFAADINVPNSAELLISGLYTAVNSAVVYTQLELAGRIGKNYLRFYRRLQEDQNVLGPNLHYTQENLKLRDLALTMGAQMVFLAQYDGI